MTMFLLPLFCTLGCRIRTLSMLLEHGTYHIVSIYCIATVVYPSREFTKFGEI